MANPQDMKAAEATYESFIGTLKFVVPALAALTLLIIFLIS